MANTKISELSAVTALAGTDVFPVVDVSASTTNKVSVENLLRNAPDGSAGAPSIANASDQDTGILFPADNSVGVSTGGTQRLVIDSSGNLGIGSSAPAAKLDVAGNQIFTAANPQIQFNAGGPIIRLPSANTLAFLTDSSNERMRIDSSGNLAVGSTSPQARLEVRQDSSTAYDSSDDGAQRSGTSSICITNHNSSNNSFSQLVFDTAGSNQSIARIVAIRTGTSSNDLAFVVEGGNTKREAMRIKSSGNVGIGTSSASTKFHLTGTDDNFITLDHATRIGSWLISHSGTNSENLEFKQNNGSTTVRSYLAGRDVHEFHTNGSEKVRIDSSGRVGIGASSPGTDLDVNNGSANCTIRARTATGFSSFLSLLPNGSGTGVALAANADSSAQLFNQLNSHLAFGTNNTERMRIDSSGNVGVGITPTAKFHVSGTIQSQTGSTVAQMFTDGGAAYFTSVGAYPMVFQTNGSERIRITSDGLVYIGNSSPTIGGRLSLERSGFVQYNRCSGTGSGNIPLILERASDDGVEIEFKRANTVVGNINVTSTTTNYATSSDYRLKENVVDLDGAITRVKQLAPKRFNFIADADTTVDGFLAHEAQTVVPEAITGTHNEVDGDGNPVMQGIDQSKLVPLLTAALQEAITKIETLEAKVAALEAQ